MTYKMTPKDPHLLVLMPKCNYLRFRSSEQFFVVQSLSCVWLFVTPLTADTKLPCPSPSPGVCSNSGPLSRWCHPTISSSVVPFSSCLQSLPASGSFPMSQFFTSGGQSIGTLTSASVLPVNIQGWFPSGLTCLISLLFKGLSGVFFNTTFWNVVVQLIYGPILTSIHDYW